MRFTSLAQRLFLITAVAVLPTALILLVNLVVLRGAEQREINEEALRAAQLAALEMERIISGTESVLRTIAAAPVVLRADFGRCSEYLARLTSSLAEYASVGIAEADGQVRCMSQPGEPVSIADRPYFRRAMESDARVIGEYTVGRLSDRAILPIALRLEGARGEPVIAVATIDLAWLGARLKERSFADEGSLTIADRNGVIIAREPLPEQFVGTRIPDSFSHLVDAEEPGTLLVTSQDGTRRVIGYYPVSSMPSGLYISAGLSTGVGFAAINSTLIRGGLIAFVGIVTAFLLARSTSQRFIARPVLRLLGTVEAWRHLKSDARTGMADTDGELGRVGAAIDVFMDELVASRVARTQAERARDLVKQELDHRVKNLLTMVQAVAHQTFRGQGDGTAVRVFEGRLEAMGRAHGLLVAESAQAAPIHDLIRTAIGPFDDPVQSRFLFGGPDLAIEQRAAMALAMALHELCTNAAKYGALSVPSGRVTIRWSVDRTEQDSTVASGGPGFTMCWSEQSGPPVAPPGKVGFGTRMIEQVLAIQIEGTASVEFRPEGVVCTISCPLAQIVDLGDPVVLRSVREAESQTSQGPRAVTVG